MQESTTVLTGAEDGVYQDGMDGAQPDTLAAPDPGESEAKPGGWSNSNFLRVRALRRTLTCYLHAAVRA